MTGSERWQRCRALAQPSFGDDAPDDWPGIGDDLPEPAGFSAIWSRPRIGVRDRALLAVGMTAAIGAVPRRAWDSCGALRVGVTRTEIHEAVIPAVGCARLSAAWDATRTPRPVLDARQAG